jgi:hypothetical protein
MLKEYLYNVVYGEAHDVAVGTADGTDKESPFTLNAVSAGFVHRFPGIDICLEDVVSEGVEGY